MKSLKTNIIESRIHRTKYIIVRFLYHYQIIESILEKQK